MNKDLLIEVGTEELPPKALRTLMDAFASGVESGLDDARLEHGAIESYASPRRLAVIVRELAAGQADREVLHKGPPVAVAFDENGTPTRAATAFADKCGVTVEELGREKTAAGEWLACNAVEQGRPAASLVPGVVQAALDKLPIPRRMRWGAGEEEFVRPVHWLLMLHGDTVIQGAVLGIESGDRTRGHRFHCDREITIGTPGEYAGRLESEGFVVADFEARRDRIVTGVTAAAQAVGGRAIGDDALFDEVTALTEWPVAVTGAFEESFLALPREVIIATLTGHQRYFPIATEDGGLLPAFITVANIESREPDRVRDGNERVIRPRLADAQFFWETDQKTPLAERTEALKNVVYQQKLGSLHDKSMRVAALATLFADQLGIDREPVTRAAVLAKCDLVTGMVGEFPELQGTMGAYYAEASGESEIVSTAIAEQYLPRFSGDRLPASQAGQILAIADKLDTLAGIFALGKKPSGNRDPFGLRRAALGVIRILVEGEIELDLRGAVKAAVVQQPATGENQGTARDALYEFIMDRLRSYFVDGESGYGADMFDAVRARDPETLPDFIRRLSAVAEFMKLEAAISLAAANKRTANILKQAERVADGELPGAL